MNGTGLLYATPALLFAVFGTGILWIALTATRIEREEHKHWKLMLERLTRSTDDELERAVDCCRRLSERYRKELDELRLRSDNTWKQIFTGGPDARRIRMLIGALLITAGGLVISVTNDSFIGILFFGLSLAASLLFELGYFLRVAFLHRSKSQREFVAAFDRSKSDDCGNDCSNANGSRDRGTGGGRVIYLTSIDIRPSDSNTKGTNDRKKSQVVPQVPWTIPDVGESRFEPVVFAPSELRHRQLIGIRWIIAVPIVWIVMSWIGRFLNLPFGASNPLRSNVHLLFFLFIGALLGAVWGWEEHVRPRYIRLAPGIIQVIQYGWLGRGRPMIHSYPIRAGAVAMVFHLRGSLWLHLKLHDQTDRVQLTFLPNVDEAMTLVWNTLLSRAESAPLSEEALVG